MILHTIGHSNKPIEQFLGHLAERGVSFVVDVRSRPNSRFGQFNRGSLEGALRHEGLSYVYLGDLLGGRPEPLAATGHDEWRQGKLSPGVVASLRRTKRWQEGLAKLTELIMQRDTKGQSGCLLCSEDDPQQCHRLAVALDAAVLLPGLEISHIVTSPKAGKADVGYQGALI